MTISVDFGSAPGGTVGYQFFDTAGLLGSRVTTGISNPRVGIYYKASVTPDTGAIGVYWDDGTISASEIFQTNPLPDDAITSSVIAASAYQGIVDSLLDELLSGHVIAGSVGVALTNSSTNATRVQTAMELDGSVYRFTTNALEQAPGGGAGTSEAFLTYDWDGITGEPAYCLLNAMRAILNKKTQSPGYINVLKEDGATVAYQVPITTAVSPAVGVTETGEPAQ